MPSSPRWVEAVNKALAHPDNKRSGTHILHLHPLPPPGLDAPCSVYQVSTVDAEGHPRVRTQVHRAFTHPDGRPDLPLLVTSTDARSPKVAQLHHAARAELAWWLPGTQDQFRVAAFAHVVPARAAGAPTPLPDAARALRLLRAQGAEGLDARRARRALVLSAARLLRVLTDEPAARALAARDEQPHQYIHSHTI